MATEIRFLADEHIDLPAFQKLKLRGVDIISVIETNLRSSPDREILEFANKNGRAVITMDKDFIVLSSSVPHKGIIFLTRRLDTGDIIREVEKLLLVYKPHEIANSVVYAPLRG
ncbi:MAG: DUF5615 family PIN-like protein [Candidatus Aenigmarchaeota archaeon]|nr:DUF5615 family PIN-like protein [Candidatus Aenigmarchaeota archaeon]